MSTKKAIAIFEAFLGNEFRGWRTDEKTKISSVGHIIRVVREDDVLGTVTTTFDLDLIPAFTIAMEK